MATQYSTALENYIAGTGSLAAGLNNCLIKIFSGPIPTNADVAIDGSSVLLVTVSAGGAGTPCTWNAAAANGVLSKTTAETWTGTIAASGTASFFRIYVPALGTDTGAAAEAASPPVFHRVQGSCGVDVSSDMVMPSTTLTAGNAQSLGMAQLL
jgi:hypothetical protein